MIGMRQGRARAFEPAAEAKVGAANSTAERAFETLLVFSDERPIWSAAELAAHFAMPRSTMYRYINTLRRFGLIAEDEHGGYRLGPQILQLARVARRSSSIMQIATPHLAELNRLFNEAVIINEKVGREMITLERVESRQVVTVSWVRAQLFPWPAAASAKVLLAFAEPEEQRALLAKMKPVRYTAKTIADHDMLRAAVEIIRRQGYAVGREELDGEVCGVAAPIFWKGECRFTLSVAAPSFRMTEEKLPPVIAAVRAKALAISQALDRE